MIEISTDRARLDIDRVHRWLSDDAYWCLGIPRDVLERAIASSLCFGAFEHAEQVGFARVISDHATYAYLCDVYVSPTHRNRGIGKALLRAICEHPSLQGLRRWSLVTRDAHSLYAQFGFTPLAAPERMMEIAIKDAYLRR
jgi:GNAT superfamily N-acetyltransferase